MAYAPTRVGKAPAFAQSLDRSHPWSELGVSVEGMNYHQALIASKSNDEVTAQTAYVIDPYFKDDLDPTAKRYVEIPDRIATHSNIYGPMGVHSSSYEIMQRHEIVDMAFTIAGLTNNEAEIKVMGNIGRHAEKFFAYMTFPEIVIDPNGIMDKIERGLWVATSFDGSLENIIGYGAIRLSCLNQVTMHLRRGLQQRIGVKHTKNMEENLREAAFALGWIGAVEDSLVKNAEKMLSVDGDKAMNALLGEFYPHADTKVAEEKRTVERNQIMSLFAGPGNTNIDLVGDNGWAAFNAVVEYWDHARPIRINKRHDSEKVQRAEAAVLHGTGMYYQNKVKASNVVLALAA